APQATGRLPVPDDLLVKARRLMPEGRVYVGLAPGAGNRAKVWPLSRYIDLAALQAAKGRVPVFLLGPDENDWHSDIETTIPQAIFPLQDRAAWDNTPMSIEQTLAIGSFLSVAVANDSGTGHMLAAIDCPLISLFGPTSPAKLAPRVSRGLVIKAQDFGGESMTHIGLQCVEKAIENVI
ncbi:MAG: glycosyltransferase family 9 protein, partial [Alphaproteobacteria bacterium]|nr:glycosyltransferase family 9 protein [Alphaproteobacteria bacterium]